MEELEKLIGGELTEKRDVIREIGSRAAEEERRATGELKDIGAVVSFLEAFCLAASTYAVQHAEPVPGAAGQPRVELSGYVPSATRFGTSRAPNVLRELAERGGCGVPKC